MGFEPTSVPDGEREERGREKLKQERRERERVHVCLFKRVRNVESSKQVFVVPFSP